MLCELSLLLGSCEDLCRVGTIRNGGQHGTHPALLFCLERWLGSYQMRAPAAGQVHVHLPLPGNAHGPRTAC